MYVYCLLSISCEQSQGCSNIMAHLDEHKLLSDKKHASRRWHSCETQLATVINDWAKILDNKGQVETFILDFEKAFYTPTYGLLKSKLFSYGVGGKTLKWINCKWCQIRLGPCCIGCPTGNCSRPLVILLTHK